MGSEDVVSEIDRLGFIGLGVMGGRMCRNLAQKSGCRVIGHDIDGAKTALLSNAGIVAAASVAEVVEGAEMIFICVPGEPQVRELAFGEGGLVAAARAGQTVVDMTTATVEINREVAAALAAKGVDFADAPVARGVPAAENGTLAIMVGASHGVLARITPFLQCMGSDISHCGDVGTGQVMKLMNNMVGIHRQRGSGSCAQCGMGLPQPSRPHRQTRRAAP